nr:unnamed protein product [Callosobruchus analis]
MACPSTPSEIRYLVENGIQHLVTLSTDMEPPMDDDSIRDIIRWTVIPVVEFEPPTLHDMQKFIAICEQYAGRVSSLQNPRQNKHFHFSLTVQTLN